MRALARSVGRVFVSGPPRLPMLASPSRGIMGNLQAGPPCAAPPARFARRSPPRVLDGSLGRSMGALTKSRRVPRTSLQMSGPMRSSLVLVAISAPVLVFGLYLTALSVGGVITYERAMAASGACTAPTPGCGGVLIPPWGFVFFTALVVLAGVIPFVWGVVRMRRERRQQSHASAA